MISIKKIFILLKNDKKENLIIYRNKNNLNILHKSDFYLLLEFENYTSLKAVCIKWLE